MPAVRTQIYLTAEQRKLLRLATKAQHRPMAAIVRSAIDAYLADSNSELADALDRSFGRLPDLSVPPREEWDRLP